MQSFWKSHFLTLALITLDLLVFCLLWRGAHAWREMYPLLEQPINDWENYKRALPQLLPVWVGILAYFRQYAHKGRISSLNQAGDILKASGLITLATLAISQLTKSAFSLGSSVGLVCCAMTVPYLYISRSMLRALKQRMRQRGVGLTRVAIIGAGDTGRKVALNIINHAEVGYELAGFIDRDAARLGGEVAGIPVIGDGSELVNLLLRYRIEEVFLAVPNLSHDETFNLVVLCEEANVHFKIVKNDMLEVITDRVKIDDIGDFPVILLREGRLTPAGLLAKRTLDLLLTIPAQIVIAPFMALIALAIKLDSLGSVIFSHERVGKDGKLFLLHKFRTMRSETDPYAIAPGDQSDARITRVGRFLRRTSLDELPQLWNVIKGDMSLVGPRPEMPFIVAQYEPWQRRRLDVPQGLTGLWQIAGRKQLPLHFNLEYDFYYIRNWSLLLDLTIMVRTIPAVIFGKGAF